MRYLLPAISKYFNSSDLLNPLQMYDLKLITSAISYLGRDYFDPNYSGFPYLSGLRVYAEHRITGVDDQRCPLPKFTAIHLIVGGTDQCGIK